MTSKDKWTYHTYLNVFKRGCGGKENQWGPVAVSVKEANPRMVVCAMLHHKVGGCTYTRDVTSKKNLDRIFINPRTTRVPIIKVIKYQHGAASDSVSFINNHLQSTKKLSVGSIQEIIQGRRPESLNLQILGASKHQTEENKYRLKMTDGRDLIDEAVLDSSEMSPPKKFSHHPDQWQRHSSKCYQAPSQTYWRKLCTWNKSFYFAEGWSRYWLPASCPKELYTMMFLTFQNFRLFVMSLC